MLPIDPKNVGFVEALDSCVEQSLLKLVQQAHFYSIMADECTDITTVERYPFSAGGLKM